MENKIKKQLAFTSDAEVILTYSSHDNKHGICGHFFEVIEYYILLKKYYNVEIVLGEDISKEEIEISLSKYDPNLVKDLKIKFSRPRIYNCPNTILIFTDGLLNDVNIYNVKGLILFPCGTRDYSKFPLYNNIIGKILFMVDERLNYKLPPKAKKINYVKKLNFDALNPILKTDRFNYMERLLPNEVILYATSNCKLINNCTIKKHLSNLNNLERLLILINKESPLLDDPIIDKQVCYRVVPIHNIFEIMSTYIYTPIERKWDCSPRMIAECKYFGIPVIYDNNIDDDYLKIDTGLMVRKWDIENNFDSLYLDDSDIIIETIRQIREEK
jgi:hypothetical protein